MQTRTPDDYQRLYQLIGRHLEAAPPMQNWDQFIAPAARAWIGKSHALVDEANVGADPNLFTLAMGSLYTNAWHAGLQKIFGFLHHALSHCELKAPLQRAAPSCR